MNNLKQARLHQTIRPLDYYFSQRLIKHITSDDDDALLIALAATLISYKTGEGNICVDLSLYEKQNLFFSEEFKGILAPDLTQWKAVLTGHAVIGKEGENTKGTQLVLDGNKLYLTRYWYFETELATQLLERAVQTNTDLNNNLLKDGLNRLFKTTEDEIDWQKEAAITAISKSFTIISGGPGTGKTHTVAAILALLLEQVSPLASEPLQMDLLQVEPTKPSRLRIALAAPTGKAAARLSDSIRQVVKGLNVSDEIKALIPDETQTLHRLLGVYPDRVTPRHHQDNPLHFDVVIVDESSMIDLPMMTRLLNALGQDTKLILLGDKDQLASVEAGSVFADLCLTQPASSLSSNLAMLKKSYRFADDSGIGHLAKAINLGDVDGVRNALASKYDDIVFQSPNAKQFKTMFADLVKKTSSVVMESNTAEEALKALEKARILCATRKGSRGVVQINEQVEGLLIRLGLIDRNQHHYQGRPIMIMRNDYHLDLYNGDLGVLWPNPDANNELYAGFMNADHQIRWVMINRLPEHEAAYAMTVHKSQGSEFDKVLMLLPEQDMPVLTRELIYTGVTRAAKEIEIWGDLGLLLNSVQRSVDRGSGLSDRLHF